MTAYKHRPPPPETDEAKLIRLKKQIEILENQQKKGNILMKTFNNIKKNLLTIVEIALSTVTKIEAVEEKCDNPALSRELKK